MMLNDESSENIAGIESAWEEIRNAVKSTPTMVFSVIGDSDSFVPRPWPRTVLQTALIEAAKSGGESWILYSGKNYGVSKVVKEAYQKYENREFGPKVDAIHIDNRNRHVKLINFTDNEAAADRDMETVVHCNTQNGEVGNFLLKFEKFVSEQDVSFFNQKDNLRMPVPIAIIVCEGDIETIAHIAAALQNKLPVIIMKGSGKAADLILDYLQKSSDLRKNAGIHFGIKFEETHFQTLVRNLKIIRRNRSLVGVFDLNIDDPLKLSNVVGEAVVSCWSIDKIHLHDRKDAENESEQQNEGTLNKKTSVAGHHIDITGLSITWKSLRNNFIRPEETVINELLEGYKKEPKSGVLNTNFISPTSLPLYFYFGFQLLQESDLLQKCGHILLLEALKANRCDYVKVLLDQGVKLKSKDLPELYGQTVSCKECQFEKDDCLHMQWILKQILETEAHTLCQQYRCAMEKSRKDSTQREKHFKKITDFDVSVTDSAKRLCCKILQFKERKTTTTTDQNAGNCDTSDILLWSIFSNRKDIAEICWIRGENHIMSGLVCSVLLQKLSKKAKNVEEHNLSTDLTDHAKLFEQRCIRILDEMYKDDTKHAVEMMDDEAMIWGVKSSPLTIAYEYYIYDVVAHACSRKLLNKRWYNNMAPALKPFLKSAFQRPTQFITAPLTRYILTYMMFLAMLVMFSAFVLILFTSPRIHDTLVQVVVIYVLAWATGDLIEEVISCFGYLGSHSRFHYGHYRRIKRYLYDFWNALDVLSYVLLTVAVICVFNRYYYITLRAFAMSLLVMYLRFLEVFLIHRKLGPTLIMIKEMLKDLLYFLIIFAFVILGVGIYYHALRFQNFVPRSKWTEWQIWSILYYPYWQMYAEFNLEYLSGCKKDTCNQGIGVTDSITDWSVTAVAGVYVLFANLVLVNLVIAMFSYTFERVQQNSEKLWWYARYTAVHDYQWRIPPPFNLFFLPYRIFMACKRKNRCSQRDIEIANGFADREKKRRLSAKEYRRELQKIIACSIYNKI